MRKRGKRIKDLRRNAPALLRAFTNQSPIPAERASTIGMACHWALKSLEEGNGSDGDMSQVAYAVNLAMMLCELGVGAEFIEYVREAQDCLAVAGAVSKRKGYWVIDEKSVRAIDLALHLHDQQIQMASQAQIGAAERAIKVRLEAGNVIRVEPSTGL